jgi:hypothetical protein
MFRKMQFNRFNSKQFTSSTPVNAALLASCSGSPHSRSPSPIRMNLQLPDLPTLSPFESTASVTSSQQLFSSPEKSPATRSVPPPTPQDNKVKIISSSSSDEELGKHLYHTFHGNLSPDSRAKVEAWKRQQKNVIDLSGCNEFWSVRHYKPKSVFNIPVIRRWKAKDAPRPTTTYYVCEEQLIRSKREPYKGEPWAIRPHFVRRCKKNKSVPSVSRNTISPPCQTSRTAPKRSAASPPPRPSPPAKRNLISKYGLVNPAPPVGTPPNAQSSPQVQVQVDSSDDDLSLPSIQQIFENTGEKTRDQPPTSPPVPPSPPPPTPERQEEQLPPVPTIVEDDTFFKCSFHSENIQFQLTVKKK